MKRAGLLVRADGRAGFVPADIAVNVVPAPILSQVTGAPLEMALVSGRVLPVIALGAQTGTLLVCQLAGELVGFSGLTVDEAGFFAACEGGVDAGGRLFAELDLEGELKRVERELGTPRLSSVPRTPVP